MSASQSNSLFFSSKQQKSGFSLVELLVVVAIMGILAGLAAQSIAYISRAGSMNSAVSGISLCLAQARAYAMANNTYVWVGFSPGTNSQDLTVAVVASTTGDSGDLASAALVARPHIYDHMELEKLDNTYPGLTSMPTNGDDISGSKLTSFKQNVGGEQVNFPSVIQFSPEGAATIGSGTSHWIQIGLQPIRGGNKADPNVAVFQVGGLTGQVQVYRPGP